MGKIYVEDIGTRLRTTLNSDLSGYSTVEYKIKKPDGTIITKPCEIEDELNGIVYYDTVLGDLNTKGVYLIQAEIIFTNGNKNKSVTRDFIVYDLYK